MTTKLKTPYYSYKIGELAKGCKLCVKGSKMVMFITGLCPRCCYYCPVSDAKFRKDVIYADEWNIGSFDEAIKEAKLIDAEGAGFTGGDPLCRLDRTVSYIKGLKKEFGPNFHIHLYTSLDLVNEDSLKGIYDAGLDEIRFHLDLDDDKLWKRLGTALNLDWDVGVEIPVVPGKEMSLKKIILFLDEINKKSKSKIFLNLNELEIADNKVNKLLEMGFKTKDDLSYAVKGSQELALNLLRFISKNKIKMNVHYCTATLKDKVQLGNRIKRRAKNVAKNYDEVTKIGTLIRGAVYFSDLKPGFGYTEKLKNISEDKKNYYIGKLDKTRKDIQTDFKINNIEVDEDRLRLLCSVKDVKKIRDKVNACIFEDVDDKGLSCKKELVLAVVEEYPTQDKMIIELDFL
ncbi:MAG: radical SAM protein [Nanoarchaeota archaeon]